MSSLEQVLLTSSFTIFGGFVVYVLGQLFSRYVLDPSVEIRRIIGEVDYALEFYANVYTAPDLTKEDLVQKSSDTLRELACRLRAQCNSTLGYSTIAAFMGLPATSDIEGAAKELIGLSNLAVPGNSEDAAEGPGRYRVQEFKRDIDSYRNKIRSYLGLTR